MTLQIQRRFNNKTTPFITISIHLNICVIALIFGEKKLLKFTAKEGEHLNKMITMCR